MHTMKAVVFKGKDRIVVEEVPRPRAGFGEAVIRITATTICGTDVHIVRGEYPVRPGLILGHEPVGVIDELGGGLEGIYHIGQRVIVGQPRGSTRENVESIPDRAQRAPGTAGMKEGVRYQIYAPGRSTCSRPMRAPTWRRCPPGATTKTS